MAVRYFERSIWEGLIVSILLGVLLASAIGAVAIKKRGVYFAMISMAVAQMLYFLALSPLKKWTGGEDGLKLIPKLSLQFPFHVDLQSPFPLYYFVYFVVGLSILAIWRILNSPFGRLLQAIRENEARTIASGYDVTTAKLISLVFSGLFSALAGGLFFVYLGYGRRARWHPCIVCSSSWYGWGRCSTAPRWSCRRSPTCRCRCRSPSSVSWPSSIPSPVVWRRSCGPTCCSSPWCCWGSAPASSWSAARSTAAWRRSSKRRVPAAAGYSSTCSGIRSRFGHCRPRSSLTACWPSPSLARTNNRCSAISPVPTCARRAGRHYSPGPRGSLASPARCCSASFSTPTTRRCRGGWLPMCSPIASYRSSSPASCHRRWPGCWPRRSSRPPCRPVIRRCTPSRPVSWWISTRATSRSTRPRPPSSLGATMIATVRNTVIHPVVLPVLAGLAWNATGLGLNAVVDETLALLGSAVVPICLVLIGLSLAYYGVQGHLRGAMGLSLVKLAVQPALVLLVAQWGFGLSGVPLAVVVMMAALPVGSNPLIFAQRYATLPAETTAAIVFSPIAFVATAAAWLALLARWD